MSKGMFGPLTPNQDNRAYDLFGIWQPVKLVVRGHSKIKDVWFKPTLSTADVDIELAGKADRSRRKVTREDRRSSRSGRRHAKKTARDRRQRL
jgi:hypothetical protein